VLHLVISFTGCTIPATATEQSDNRQQPTRVRRLSSALDSCIVLSTTGDSLHSEQDAAYIRLKRLLFGVVDNVVAELKSRFDSVNSSLSLAVSALLPGTDNCFNEDHMSPLIALLKQHRQFYNDAFRGELTTASSMLRRKLEDNKDLQQAALCMLPYKEAFPQLDWLYAASLTIGVSIATCENVFSCREGGKERGRMGQSPPPTGIFLATGLHTHTA